MEKGSNEEGNVEEGNVEEGNVEEGTVEEGTVEEEASAHQVIQEKEGEEENKGLEEDLPDFVDLNAEEPEGMEEMLCQSHQFGAEGGDGILDDEDSDIEQLENEKSTHLQDQKKMNYVEKAHVRTQQRVLNQMNLLFQEKELNVQKAREEERECRRRIEALKNEKDDVEEEIQEQEAVKNNAALFRLRAKHRRICEELRGQEDLQSEIALTLVEKERQMLQVELEQAAFARLNQEFPRDLEVFHEQRILEAEHKAEREVSMARNDEKQRNIIKMKTMKDVEERELKHRKAIEEAKKNNQKAIQFLKQSMAKVRKEEAEKELLMRENLQKRIQAVLSLKKSISANRENLRAIEARNKSMEAEEKAREDRMKEAVILEGGNVIQYLHDLKKMKYLEKKKQAFVDYQKAGKLEIITKLLKEESNAEKKKVTPQIFSQTLKSEDTKFYEWKSQRKLMKYLEKMYGDDAPPSTSEKHWRFPSPLSEAASTPQRPDAFTPESVEYEDEETIEQPEYLGLWEQELKSHQVKDDGSSKYPGTSKMERDIIKRKLEKQRRSIIHKQVVAGREFKGSPFYSKPDIIQFKNFDIGETYKMEVLLMNVSYSMTFCRLVDISDNLKDFISVEFKPPGQISAGMTCKMLVTFKPMITEDLEGEVMFLAQTGPFSVLLKCATKKCDLFVDNNFIDFGTYVVGETVTRSITLTNRGALGTHFQFAKLDLPKANPKITVELSNSAYSAKKSSPDSDAKSSKTAYQSSTSYQQPLSPRSETKSVLSEQKDTDSVQELFSHQGSVAVIASPTSGEVTEVPGNSPELHDPEEQETEIRIGQVSEGDIRPFTSVKLQILFLPAIPGEVQTDFEISFSDTQSKSIPIKVQAKAIDVPVSVIKPNVDLKICMYDRLYQDSILTHNRATTALQLTVEVCKELRNHIELLPKTGYIQAQSSFSFQLKFKPRQTLAEDAKNYFDKETRVLEAPMTIWVANQIMPVPFTVHAIVTNSDLEFNQNEIDFGICSIHESVWTTVLLQNKSILPQQFGFIDIPQYIDVQPNDGFGTILPLETMNMNIIFNAKQAKEYKFELICKSEINRDFKISCKAIGTYPPLELSHSVINFAATALNDSSTAVLYVMNNHTSQNEFTHPVPRIGRGKIAPVGPTSFEFIVPKDSNLTITPSVGTVLPGKKCMVQVLFRPVLTPWEIQQEAVQLLYQIAELRGFQNRGVSSAIQATESDTQSKSGQKSLKDNSPISTKTHVREPKSKSAMYKAPKSESINEDSPEYASGYVSLVRNFNSQLNSFTIPCFVAYGQTTEHKDPGYLPYSIHNTLYLEVHCPRVAPPLVLISGNKQNAVVFGDVAFGQRMVKQVKIQNISEDYLELKSSTLDPNGPFLVLNALRPLQPGNTHTLIIAFSPTESRVYFEPLEILTEKATLPINLSGTGVKPSIKCSVEGVMNIGYTVTNQIKTATFQLQNDSTLDVDFVMKLDSLSYGKHKEQQLLPAFLELKENPTLIGVQNYGAQSVFSVSPVNGCLKAKQSQEFQVTFYPDHESLHYSDGLSVELFGTVSRVIQLKGAARDSLAYVEGGDPVDISSESLTILPKYGESGQPVETKPVLLILRSVPSDNKFTTAVREFRVGCIRSNISTTKKNVELYFDSLQGLQAKGFNIDPTRISVDAGNSRTITVSWLPSSGYDPSHTTVASIKMTTKGNVTEIYQIFLIAKVVLA
ncbi:cilia- and flagella-associated protein 74 isoform X1 [Callorhinchus milii]|nr:cilia- and flagella-associated protein 74 isoform X1 [Callorhinchus milii]XP_042199681.1 cilia- and flagella-associated protein 74 isoform X1 [Callorhinchus milii]